MGLRLEPLYAANLAADVYDVKSIITRDDFIADYANDMEFGDDGKATFANGKTGGYIINKSHVMAVFAQGKGRYQGQAFVAIKGTASLYDALTDLNTGIRTGHTGNAVHQGFYYAFNSLLKELRQFVMTLKGVTVIHCVGHSLGGAIATLAADWLKTASSASKVNLYTFGSPRVGLEMFASRCTTRLNPENIYRVYHQTDPVPMLPTWPFIHVPTSNIDYLMYSPVAGIPWEYHFMEHYIDTADKAGSWEVMKKSRPKDHLDATVERWLKSDGIISLTANTLELLNAALIYVVKKIVNLAGIVLVAGAASAFTLLDRLAMFMAKAAKVASDVSIWVFRLIKRMASVIGIVVSEGTDLTVSFVRFIFIRLHQKVSEMIWNIGRALD